MAFQCKKPAAIGTKTNYPGFIEPALASSIKRVPTGERWVHEIKFDGYRVQVHLANESIRVFTRRGNDWTKRFKKIANEAFLIGASQSTCDCRRTSPMNPHLTWRRRNSWQNWGRPTPR